MKSGNSARSLLQRVVFPAPEGADTTIISGVEAATFSLSEFKTSILRLFVNYHFEHYRFHFSKSLFLPQLVILKKKKFTTRRKINIVLKDDRLI